MIMFGQRGPEEGHWRKLRWATAAFVSAVVAAIGAAPGFAQTELDPQEAKADRLDIDLFSPSGPAFVALGGSPRRAADPGALQDFKIDFGSVSDGEKNRLGAAFSVVPYWLGDKRISLTDYRNATSEAERVWARTQASVGVARAGGEDTEAIRLSFAVQTQLFDRQDFRFDQESYNCISNAWNQTRRGANQQVADELAERLASGEELTQEQLVEIQMAGLRQDDGSTADYLSARKTCRDEAAKRLMAEPSWKAGAGVAARSEEDELGSFDYDGVSLWSSFRQPLDGRGRFAAFTFVRGDIGRVFDFDDDLRAEGDGVEAGIGGAFQSPRFRLDLSVAHNHRSFDEGPFDDEDFQRYTGVVDVRVREGIWLELSGGTIVNSDLIDGAFGSVNVKVAWGDYLPFGGR